MVGRTEQEHHSALMRRKGKRAEEDCNEENLSPLTTSQGKNAYRKLVVEGPTDFAQKSTDK